MTNLYTQIIKRKDHRIEILSQLKQQWNNRPVDTKEIKRLQKELDQYDAKHKSPTHTHPHQHTKLVGIFN